MPADDKEDTRAIARQAVEAEFRKKKKKRYDSSDDEGEGGSKKKQKNAANPKTETKKPTRPVAIWEVKYRDRAKERREGKEAGEQDDGILSSNKTNQSGEHSLLEDVLEDEDRGEDQPIRGLDRSMMEKYGPGQEDKKDSRYVSNRQEALEWLAACEESSLRSTLGRDLLPVLRRQYLPAPAIEKPSPAGLAIQRSTFLFSTVSDTHLNPWQVPREEIAAAASNNHDASIPKLSPIQDKALLERIQRALERQKQTEKNAAKATSMIEKQETKAKARLDDSDEDIFRIDDDNYNEDDEAKRDLSLKKESAIKETSEKSRRTFFFNPPTEGTTPATVGEEAPTVSLTGKLERLSEVDGGYDVDFDGRLEEEDGKQKKKQKRKKKDGDDSD